MHKKCLIGLVVAIFTISFCSMALAMEDRPELSFDETIYSKYVWRGFELSDDSIVLFNDIRVGYKGFEFEIWTDFDTDYAGATTGNNDTQLWETDWLLTYSNALGPVNWTVGWIYYDVDGGEDEEIFAVLGLADCPLSPEFSVWKGIQYGDDTYYYNLSVSHSLALENDWSLDLGASAGFYSIEGGEVEHHAGIGLVATGDDYDELHDCNLYIGLNVPVNDWCTITPSINYSFPLSSDAEDKIEHDSFDGDDSDWLYGGVNINITF